MSTFKKIKEWYKIVEPHKGYLWGMFISSIIGCFVPILQAIPSANVITCLTNYDYKTAVFWLLTSLACTFVYYLTWHFNYKFYYLHCKHGTIKLSTKLYDKISTATENGLSKNSIEKIMLAASTNVDTLVGFADKLTYQSCYVIRAFVTIAIVSFYNIYIGLIMLAVVVVLYFWYVYLGNLAQKHIRDAIKARENLAEKLTDAIEGKTTNQKLNLLESNKEQYLLQVKKVIKSYSKRGLVNVARKHWTYIALYIVVTALTIWLAVLTDANNLTLTLYLIIAPYLINIIDYAKSGYEVLYELERADVVRMQISTVLNMPSIDIVNYSNNSTDVLSNNLVFSNITYVDTQTEANKCGSLSNTTFEIEPHKITLIKGSANCGKRSIFYLLRRTITPTTGTITMDGINIYDFDKTTYMHNLSYVTSKPYFYSESIMENLQYVCPSRNKIIKICKQLDIHKHILALPNGYDTNLIKEKEHLTPYLLFMIGLARAVLSNSEWICIYEFPLSLATKQQKELKEHLLKLKANHSIIIFSAGDSMQDICDNYFSIAAGHLRKLTKVEG